MKHIKGKEVRESLETSDNTLKPFWNEQCGAISSKLWLPTEIDWQDLATNLSASLLNPTVDNSWFSVKKYATQILPEWTKSCPFQIKGIAIKEAVNAFFKAKGRPRFHGIYPRVAGKGLFYSETLPEVLMDSRLIWKAGKWFIALPRKEQKAFEFGKYVQDVSEAYASKTHPETGEIRKIGSAKRIKLQNDQWVDRDEMGARNILLRALVDSPDSIAVAVAETCSW
jgi:hypothetical protein